MLADLEIAHRAPRPAIADGDRFLDQRTPDVNDLGPIPIGSLGPVAGVRHEKLAVLAGDRETTQDGVLVVGRDPFVEGEDHLIASGLRRDQG